MMRFFTNRDACYWGRIQQAVGKWLVSESLFFMVIGVYLLSLVFSSNATEKAMWASLGICVLLALLSGLCPRCRQPVKPGLWVCLILTLAVYPLLVFVAASLVEPLNGAQSRLYSLPLYFLLLPLWLSLNRAGVAVLGRALMVAAAGSLLWLLYTMAYLGLGRLDLDEVGSPIIIYDGVVMTMLLMGMVYALEQYRQDLRPVVYLRLVLICMAMCALTFHGSRGSWVGVLLLIPYLFWCYWRSCRRPLLLIGVLLAGFVLWAGYSAQSPLKSRVEAANKEVHLYQAQGNAHSSVGARLAMWQIAWRDFKQAPLTGVGLDGAKDRRCQAQRQGLLSQCYVHAHNIYLQEMAAHGVPGLVGLLLLFLVPLWVFGRTLWRTGLEATTQQCAARMGLVAVTYTMVCGLFDLQLGFRFSMGFYCFMVTMLMYWVFVLPMKVRAAA